MNNLRSFSLSLHVADPLSISAALTSPLHFVLRGPKPDITTAHTSPASITIRCIAEARTISSPPGSHSSSAELLPSQPFPAFTHPSCRICHLSLLNFTRFPSAHSQPASVPLDDSSALQHHISHSPCQIQHYL